ncbi:MAG TPA: ribosome biogenesis GTPase Der, partial [Verrucomicrobiaceae bacterium]
MKRFERRRPRASLAEAGNDAPRNRSLPPRGMVAIVGRPNVGKSALFNRLAGRNIAIVHDRPGVTRDRLTAVCRRGDPPFEIMDTGGIGESIADEFNAQVQAEANLAIDVSDVILFVVDGSAGITPVDQTLAQTFRRTTKPVVLVVNKCDRVAREAFALEFSRLGFKSMASVSAAHGLGIEALVGTVSQLIKHVDLPAQSDGASESALEKSPPLKLAIVGRPNAGKSSLINAVLGRQRTIVSEVAGTTRDAVDIPCEVNGRRYLLIDTAGLRRKAKIHDEVETFSALQATRSIKRADLCVLIVDCAEGAAMQDRKIAQIIVNEQKPCLIVLNKFDLYHPDAKKGDRLEALLETMRREFFFMPYAPMIAVSAKHGQQIYKIFTEAENIRQGAHGPPGTGVLNRLLHDTVDQSSAALGRSGKSFHLLYATFMKEESHPAIPVPHILLFANRVDRLQDS